MSNLTFNTKLASLSPELKKVVADFIDFLTEKSPKKRKKKTVPKFGSAKGKIRMTKDFDSPIDDFKEYM